MPGDAPGMRRIRLKLASGSQFIEVPGSATCVLAEAIGRELHTVWHCPDQPPAARTVRLAFIERDGDQSRPFSPDWRHVITCRDGLGGYITLLDLAS